MIKTTFFTSFLFFINSIVAFYYHYLLYSFLFFCLAFSSIYYHSGEPSFLNYNIDQIIILCVVLYGGYMFYNKIIHSPTELTYQQIIISALIVFTFLTTIYLFYYGKILYSYCWHPEPYTANFWHAVVHIIGSIGHVLIMVL